MSLPESLLSNVTPVGECKPTKKKTVWSEAMTAGEPKTQRVPKKGTPWFLLVGETWVTKTANSFSNIPPLKGCPKIRSINVCDFLSYRMIPGISNISHEEFLDLDSMTTSFGPQKIGTKTYHTLHPRFLSKQPNIRSEKNTPILQPCWWSCSSNVKRKCSICDANSSLFLHQIMDQSAPQQIIISHHLSWTAMSFSQQSQPTRFLLSHQPGETIYMYELVLQFNGRPQRSSTAGAAGQGPWLLERREPSGQISPRLRFGSCPLQHQNSILN